MTATSNKYKKYIDELFERIGFLQGTVYHIECDLKHFEKQYLKQISESTKWKNLNFRLGSKLVISDLSGPTDKGYLYYYATDAKYVVTFDNYNEKTQNLIFEFSSFVILQAYEAFTTFFKSMLSEYFHSNNDRAARLKVVRRQKRNFFSQLLMIFNHKSNYRKEQKDFKYFMENISRGKNNSFLFKYLRKISQHYKHHEIENNKKINLLDFYTVLAIARHSITHNSSNIKDKIRQKLSIQRLKILNNFTNEENNKIELTQQKLSYILVLICELAFLIFKSLSIEDGLYWKILYEMK